MKQTHSAYSETSISNLQVSSQRQNPTVRSSEEIGANVSRRSLIRAGVGAGLATVTPTLLPGGTWSLFAQANAQTTSQASNVLLDTWVSSRSGIAGLAKQRVTVLPAASALWLVQQMHWRARGLNCASWSREIRELGPRQAQQIYNALIMSYVGNSLVAGTTWHKKMFDAIHAHKTSFVPPIDPDTQKYHPVNAGDGLYPFDINEDLNQQAEDSWKGHRGAESIKKRLETAAARGTLAHDGSFEEASGFTPVIDFWRGEISLFGKTGMENLDLSPGPSGGSLNFSSSEGDQYYERRANEAIALGSVFVGVAPFTGPAAPAMVTLGVITGLGGAAIYHILGDRSKGKSISGEEGTPQGSQNRAHFPTREQVISTHIEDVLDRYVGFDRNQNDMSISQNMVISARWNFDRIKGTMGWSLGWKAFAKFDQLQQDDTGLMWSDWVGKYLSTHYMADPNSTTNDQGKFLDTLGKEPSIPPKAVAMSFDALVPVMNSGIQDLAIQTTVIR